ncbi:hypothetical protein PIL02S_06328 [Paenibacillus illinoisensis]|uniref:Uncharacterized protein n=1 Tax=Paenibacillus illinoisensis TaxID=59845 RepID=A0A2W0C1M3_9BACL|nr:hypothetical protein PIL02S_06328 [Paenibacillus illinoisensis]
MGSRVNLKEIRDNQFRIFLVSKKLGVNVVVNSFTYCVNLVHIWYNKNNNQEIQ